ncbi:RNA-binding protein [Spartobacteria bacterium LR76]|nr:RNA-binding protein [Spartobacteria bacterium LR76]
MKLYVGNLSFKTTEQALEELFATVGTVTDTHLVMDRMTQRPRGFGFVTMSSEEEGQKAIESLNGKTFDGRPISVSVARPKEDRPPRRDFGGEGGGGGGFREHRDRDRDRDRRGGGGYDRRRN